MGQPGVMADEFVTHRELDTLIESAERERKYYAQDYEAFKRRVESMDAGGTRGLPLLSAQLTQVLLDLGAVKKAVLEDRPWEHLMIRHDEEHEDWEKRLVELEKESAAKKHTSSSWITVLSLVATIAMAVATVWVVTHGG